ncbi:MAG TPA: phosphatase PAP2 family protein [Nocardioidaceae bacterium]|nr:phosphatase PAP2 family protein [Nocardioidaceae bacterium]
MIARGREDSDGWTSAVASGFALAGFLFVVFIAFTLLAMGPLVRYDTYFSLAPPPRSWVPFLHVLDRVGQRAIAVPILAAIVFWIYRRTRSWRPVAVAAASVFALNLLVLVLKLGFGRSFPRTADPSFFTGGMAYPSGHSANIVLVYGLIAYLLSTYSSPSHRLKVLMWSAVGCLSVTMVVTSLTLNWHWFADLVAGLLIGGVVLELTATVDRMVPAHVLARGGRDGLREGLREIAAAVRPRTSRGRAAP